MSEKYKLNPECENCIMLNSILNKISEVEETIRCAVKITKLGIWQWDLITNKTYLSDEIFEITGHKKEDFEDNFDYVYNKMFHPQSQALLEKSIRTALETGIVPQEEFQILTITGQPCWVRINGEIIYDEKGNKVKMIGTVLDVTEDYNIKTDLLTDLSFFETLMEILPNPIFYKNAEGLYQFCNSAFLQYIGYDKEGIINKSVYDIAPHDLAEVYHKADLDLMAEKGQQVYESKVKYANGTFHDVIFSKAAHLDEYGKAVGLVGIIQDITEKKKTERKDKALQKIRDIFWKMNLSIMEIENDEAFFKRILSEMAVIFRGAVQSYVFNIESLDHYSVLTHCEYDTSARFNNQTCIETSIQGMLQAKNLHPITILSSNTNGAEDHQQVLSVDHIQSILLIPVQFENQTKWVLTVERNASLDFDSIDLFAAEFLQEELPIFYRIFDLTKATLQLSRYDSLTNLTNRGYFNSLFLEKLLEAKSENSAFTLITFDLDGLKNINDNYGHHSGDVYIKTFSQMLRDRLNFADIYARLGGDEFVCLVSRPFDESINQQVLKFRRDFEILDIQTDSSNFQGNFSYGISTFPEDATSSDELMKVADTRMYEDKSRVRTTKP